MARTDEPIFFKAHKSPMVGALQNAFPSLPNSVANSIKSILTGAVDLMTFPASKQRQAEAYNDHEPYVLALEAVNELIGAYGVEYVRHREDSMHESHGFYYLNFGDTYDTTLLVSAHGDNWTIGGWGDRVEANPYKYV